MPVELSPLGIQGECHRRSDGRRELRVIYPNSTFAVRGALMTTTDALRGFDMDREDCETVELVLAEVLNNVAEHAQSGDDGATVELRVLLAEDTVACDVRDCGPPVPSELLHPSDPPSPASLPEGGFGWYLIHSLCRNIAYRREDNRNILSLEISLHRRLTLS